MEPANTWTWTRPHSSADAVTALYEAHALGLVRLAVVMTGDQGSAEDIVQDAFLGLYRRWDSLTDLPYPLAYLRASVLNGCRTALRRRSRADRAHYLSEVPSESAEARAQHHGGGHHVLPDRDHRFGADQRHRAGGPARPGNAHLPRGLAGRIADGLHRAAWQLRQRETRGAIRRYGQHPGSVHRSRPDLAEHDGGRYRQRTVLGAGWPHARHR